MTRSVVVELLRLRHDRPRKPRRHRGQPELHHRRQRPVRSGGRPHPSTGPATPTRSPGPTSTAQTSTRASSPAPAPATSAGWRSTTPTSTGRTTTPARSAEPTSTSTTSTRASSPAPACPSGRARRRPHLLDELPRYGDDQPRKPRRLPRPPELYHRRRKPVRACGRHAPPPAPAATQRSPGRAGRTGCEGQGRRRDRRRKGDDTVVGLHGDDLVCGGAGADAIRGQGGDDTLRGGRGKDEPRGGGGSNKCRGGSGSDGELTAERPTRRDWPVHRHGAGRGF